MVLNVKCINQMELGYATVAGDYHISGLKTKKFYLVLI